MAMALGYKSLIKIRSVSHFHVPQSCIYLYIFNDLWSKYLVSIYISIYVGAEPRAAAQQEQVAGAAAEQISGPGQGSGLRLRQGEEEGQGQGQGAGAGQVGSFNNILQTIHF